MTDDEVLRRYDQREFLRLWRENERLRAENEELRAAPPVEAEPVLTLTVPLGEPSVKPRPPQSPPPPPQMKVRR